MVYSRKILILCFAMLFLYGCSQEEFGTRYSHYTLGVSLSVPDEWKKIELDPTASLAAMAFESGQGESILLMLNNTEDFKKQIKITSKTNGPILDRSSLLFAKYKTTWLVSKDKRTNITYILQDKEGRVFSISCTSKNLEFESHRPLFEKVTRSFESY